jgi:hypothetical protein
MDSTGLDSLFGMFIFCIYGFLCLLSLAGIGFWIWMLIDVSQREFPIGHEQEKTTWIIILLLSGLFGLCLGFPWIGALIYYITIKKKYDAMRNTYPVQPQSVPTPPPGEGEKIA